MRRYKKFRRIKKKKPLYASKAFWTAFGIAAVAGISWYVVAFAPFAQIKEVQVRGAESVDPEKIAGFAWSVIPRSILLVNTQKLQEGIEKMFPEIDNAKIRRAFSRKLIVQVQERKKVAVWCTDESVQNCFAIDRKGVAFRRENPSNELLVFSQDALEPALLSALFEFKEGSGLRLDSVSVLSGSQLRLTTSEGWNIFMNPEENIGWQLAKLKAVLEKKIPPEQRKNLEYIDLRFGDQAYIKYE
ncbi:MAG: FtsQ-type POTRA domain-containing protein [Candidatus Wildermuthbacteria bacterium]|nr:FtsQ-type POTRA domain-containing protein [Candidatus Wildermuthbacteria bacterium]